MNVSVVAVIGAYALKDNSGFRAFFKADGEEMTKSEVLPTIEAARFWARNEGFNRFPEASVAAYRGKYAFNANLWA